MATKQIWLNLPVKDVLKSRKFYMQLGFTFNDIHSETDQSAQCMLVGDNHFVIMLFPEDTFKKFSKNEITDTKKSSEILISIDAQSREEVDKLTQKAKEAGAIIYEEAGENQGWMYGSGFADLDGHQWNILFMDRSEIPK